MKRGYAAVGLYHTKKDVNLGGVLRAAFCYDAALVVVAGLRFERQASDTSKAWRHIPVLETSDLLNAIPYDCAPVAIEVNPHAVSLVNYVHPERAYYLFGPEDGALPKEVMAKCRDVVSIPTQFCMNLAATVNVVLYDRLAKSLQRGSGLSVLPAAPSRAPGWSVGRGAVLDASGSGREAGA